MFKFEFDLITGDFMDRASKDTVFNEIKETGQDTEELRRLLKVDDRDVIILRLAKMTVSIAMIYTKKIPSLGDDFIGVSMLALVRTIRNMKSLHTNPAAAVNVAVVGACKNLIKDYYNFAPAKVVEENFYKNSVSVQSVIFLEEIFNSSKFTDQEKVVLRARYQGYTDEEIAKQLGIGEGKCESYRKTTMHKIRKNMFHRLKSLIDGG